MRPPFAKLIMRPLRLKRQKLGQQAIPSEGKNMAEPLAETDLASNVPPAWDDVLGSLEEELARRFAPVVVLDGDDWTRPASVQWLLSRLRIGARHDEAPRRNTSPTRSSNTISSSSSPTRMPPVDDPPSPGKNTP